MAVGPIKLSKADVRRALVTYQFEPTTIGGVFERLKSVQFDPLAPVGSNHDLVLQARVAGYRIGDWQKATYEDRLIYDGWDKQASLVSFSGWATRRVFHELHAPMFKRVFEGHPHAADIVLSELRERGPMTPKELEFQEHKPEWKGSWHGPNLSKQTLRALWHTGKVMTHSRRGQHHVYDLSERIVPAEFLSQPLLSEKEALKHIIQDRHESVGIIRPVAPFEVWSLQPKWYDRRGILAALVKEGKLVEVDIDGVKAHATPVFLEALDRPNEPRVRFIAPLDQVMWDRKLVAHLFQFDYIWEVYKPEKLRTWGYYVLPVMFGDRFVGRVELWSRAGELEFRVWHWEPGEPTPDFWPEFEKAMSEFMSYCRAKKATFARSVDKKVKEAVRSL